MDDDLKREIRAFTKGYKKAMEDYAATRFCGHDDRFDITRRTSEFVDELKAKIVMKINDI